MKKLVLSIIFIVLITYMVVATVAIAPFYSGDNQYFIEGTIYREVECGEGTDFTSDKLEIRKDGRYVISANWKCETDMVTGFILTTPEGEEKAYCTGGSVRMNTLPIKLQAGTHALRFYYMTDAEDLAAFEKQAETVLGFDIEPVEGTSIVEGDYSVKLVAPDILWEVIYLVSVIAALMGSVLALFELILEFTKKR